MTRLTIVIPCPRCQKTNIVRNGKKYNQKQNYRCKDCGRQFIADHERRYQGAVPRIIDMIPIMLVRGMGIRDIAVSLSISVNKVLKSLTSSVYEIQPKHTHYDTLEVDEFWTYVGKKTQKMWLIYAYHRASGEIVAYVWGKRDLSTACLLRKKLHRLSVSYDTVATDEWDSFVTAFAQGKQLIGKQYTVGIEGNNCRLRHRIRRVFRKTCCFSKNLVNHFKAFDMAFF